MSDDTHKYPMSQPAKPGRGFTEAARLAAKATKAAKRAEPDRFGLPEMFVVSIDAQNFTWELRRFGGVVLQRGPEAFPSQALARADGEVALSALLATPRLPTFKRGHR